METIDEGGVRHMRNAILCALGVLSIWFVGLTAWSQTIGLGPDAQSSVSTMDPLVEGQGGALSVPDTALRYNSEYSNTINEYEKWLQSKGVPQPRAAGAGVVVFTPSAASTNSTPTAASTVSAIEASTNDGVAVQVVGSGIKYDPGQIFKGELETGIKTRSDNLTGFQGWN